MLTRPVNVVRPERAAVTAFLPVGTEHEVLNDQLAAAGEQVAEGFPSVWPIENVRLLRSHPRQLASLTGKFIAGPGLFFLLDQKRLAGAQPFFARNDEVCLHNFSMSARTATSDVCVFIFVFFCKGGLLDQSFVQFDFTTNEPPLSGQRGEVVGKLAVVGCQLSVVSS